MALSSVALGEEDAETNEAVQVDAEQKWIVEFVSDLN